MRLEFFGGPALWRNGQRIGLSPFRAGLLTVVFGSGRSLTPRSHVQRLLWGGDKGKAVRHRLSQLVYQTNNRCRARVVTLEGEYARANTRLLATDLEEFEKLIRASKFQEAGDLIERGFLSAFPRRRTDALGDWIEKQGVAKRVCLHNRAIARWVAAVAANDWSRARPAAEALSLLGLGSEAILERALRDHARRGAVREAEAMYRSIAGRVGDANALGGRAEERRSPPRARPFLGRESEMARLARAMYRRPSRSRWRAIALSGEAGIGKSRLVEEATRDAHRRGYRLMGACPGDLEREVPLSPLLEALNQPWVAPVVEAAGEPWRRRLRSLLPQLSGRGHTVSPPKAAPPTDALARRRHTCEALLHLFAAIAEAKPTLLVLDNFHAIDDASATVVEFLQRRWRRGDITLVLCHRPEELAKNRAAARLAAAIEAAPQSAAIRLRGLPDAPAEELAARFGKGGLGKSGTAEIVGLAGGNPLFLIELAAELAKARPRNVDAMRLPTKVRSVVTRRLEGLGSGPRRLLAAAAVLECPATPDELAHIAGQSRHECVEALERLQRLRLVARAGNRVDIRQGIVRRAVYRDLAPATRSALHGLAANALRASPGRRLPELVARHYQLAGQREQAYRFAVEAARKETGRAPEARRALLGIAYDVGEGAERNRVALPLAKAHLGARRLASALRYGEAALGAGGSLSAFELLEARLLSSTARELRGVGSLDDTLAQLSGIREELDRRHRDARGDGLRAAVLDATAQTLVRADRRRAAGELLPPVAMLQRSPEPRARCLSLATQALLSAGPESAGDLVRAEEAVAVARDHDLADDLALALQRCVGVLAEHGLLATARGRRVTALAKSVGPSGDNLGARVLTLLAHAKWHTATGDHGLAAAALAEARPLSADMDCPEIFFRTQLARGRLALAERDAEAALAALAVLRDRISGSASGSEEQGEANNAPWVPRRTVASRLAASLAGVWGHARLESGGVADAVQAAREHPLAEPLESQPVDLVLFHASLLARRAKAPAALDLLERAARGYKGSRRLSWLQVALALARLGRRSGAPRPDLAAEAHRRANEINLSGVALRFVPFVGRDARGSASDGRPPRHPE